MGTIPMIIMAVMGLIYLGFAIWYAIAMDRLWKGERYGKERKNNGRRY
jgi:hypothetical protein